MNLEILNARLLEIDSAINNASAQLNLLLGHKAETSHWISKLQEAEKSNETQVELPCEPVVE